MLAVTRPCASYVQAAHWPCPDPALAVRWPRAGRALAVCWPCTCRALAVHCPRADRVLTMCWTIGKVNQLVLPFGAKFPADYVKARAAAVV